MARIRIHRLRDAVRMFEEAIGRSEAQQRGTRAAEFRSRLALLQWYLGDEPSALANAKRVLTSDPSRYVAADATFILAAATGDFASLTNLEEQYPDDELIRGIWEPLTRGVEALRGGHAEAAIPFFRAVGQYDFGDYASLRSAYYLGVAFLATKSPDEARAAFQRVIDNRGVVLAYPLEGLAYLGLARAARLTGALPETRAAYERFFAIWKDADPASPLMRAARAEYARVTGRS